MRHKILFYISPFLLLTGMQFFIETTMTIIKYGYDQGKSFTVDQMNK